MPADKIFYVNVGPHGTFKPSGDVQTVAADVDGIFAHIGAKQIHKLTIHFHGGLISEKKGGAIAAKMIPVYVDAGAHPVTFVWETGLLETVQRNLGNIHQTKLFKKVLAIVLRKVIKKLGVDVPGKGAGVEPTTAEIERELQKEFPFEELVSTAAARGGAAVLSEAGAEQARLEIEAEVEEDLDADLDFAALLAIEAPVTPLLREDALEPSSAEKAKGIGTLVKAAKTIAVVAYRVIKRFVQKRDHDLYPTIVEEILRELYVADAGEWVWSGMKDAAAAMWLPNDGLAGDDRHAGRYFLEKLAAAQQASGLTLDLVGHSAGAIAICHMLRTAATAHSALRVRNVILLAPACTSDLFLAEIVKHQDRFNAVRMFTMRDDFEKRDRLFGAAYPRSLLYFISGVLEGDFDKPVVGMERYLRGDTPYDTPELLEVRKFFNPAQAPNLALSRSDVVVPPPPVAAEGFRTVSEHHGDFDDDPVTRASLTFVIKQ